MCKSVFFHIPHDGNEFPDELMRSVTIPRDLFLQYHSIMSDTDATRFAPQCDGARIVAFNVSRLLCDVERFVGEGEIMEQYGMGFCYEKAYDGTVIKSVSDEIRMKTLEIYKKHHDTVDNLIRSAPGRIVIVDLHSFSKEIIVHCKTDKPLPDICIGYDDYASEKVLSAIESAFTANGFSVARNYPYSGSFVPDCIFSGEEKREIISFMIEVNKNCYRKDGVTDINQVRLIQKTIQEIINIL